MTKKLPKLELMNVDEVPIALCQPPKKIANGSLAIWIPYLGGNRKTGIKELQQLASEGYFAISLDPYLHGDRKQPKQPSVRTLVFKEFKATMWPIIGITTLDTFRIIDWAIKNFNLNDMVVVGGLSMGGDIAIALAGIDKRIKKVVAVATSPDWLRPGMTEVFDSSKIIKQGKPTLFGEWLYNQLDPLTHIQSYSHLPKIHFELGEKDTHISPKHAIKFKKEFDKKFPKSTKTISININNDCNHLSLIQKKAVIKNAINFLIVEKEK